MGVIVKQTLIGTSLAYFGVIIGLFNALYIRPEYLNLSQIGVLNLVTANAMLFAPICTAGMTGSVIKYFPFFEKSGIARDQFFSYLLLIVIVVNAAFLLLGCYFYDAIQTLFEENAIGYVPYLFITAIIIVTSSTFDLLYAFCKAFKNIVVPSFLSDILLRVMSLGLVLGFGLGYWSFQSTIQGLGVSYALSFVILLIYMIVRHGIRPSLYFGRIDHGNRRKILNFGGYSLLLAGTYAFIENVSYVQVASLIGDAANGIFSICFMVGILMEIPRRTMLKVVAPMFSKAIEEHNHEEVKSLYVKGSIANSVIGGFIFICIFINMHDIFTLMPDGYRFISGFWVVVWICLARLIVMIFSFSQEIIAFSKHHYWALYFQILAMAILITGNYILLPTLGLLGAGLSYFFAISIQTFLKYAFVYREFRMNPLCKKHFELLVIVVVLLIFYLLPDFFLSPILNILVRTSLVIILYSALVYYRDISKDISQYIYRIFLR